jgi:protein arginine kinase
MLHLPALRITEELGRVRQAAKDLDLAVRGYHGEGSESIGDFFQISNQITLGTSEDQLLEEFLGAVVPQLVEYERHARGVLQEKKRVMLEDFVHRAHGTLLSARLLGIDEAIKLLSRLRIGRALEVVGSPDLAVIHRLLLNVQPAHLCALSGANMDENNDSLSARAEMVRKALS